jgi:hypothetical protein
VCLATVSIRTDASHVNRDANVVLSTVAWVARGERYEICTGLKSDEPLSTSSTLLRDGQPIYSSPASLTTPPRFYGRMVIFLMIGGTVGWLGSPLAFGTVGRLAMASTVSMPATTRPKMT